MGARNSGFSWRPARRDAWRSVQPAWAQRDGGVRRAVARSGTVQSFARRETHGPAQRRLHHQQREHRRAHQRDRDEQQRGSERDVQPEGLARGPPPEHAPARIPAARRAAIRRATPRDPRWQRMRHTPSRPRAPILRSFSRTLEDRHRDRVDQPDDAERDEQQGGDAGWRTAARSGRRRRPARRTGRAPASTLIHDPVRGRSPASAIARPASGAPRPPPRCGNGSSRPPAGAAPTI